MGDMVAVVRKRATWFEYGAFPDNFISFHHRGGSILVDQNPFTPEQGNGGFGEVVNGHKINEGVEVGTLYGRLLLVVDEFVEFGLQAMEFLAVFLHAVSQNLLSGEWAKTNSFPFRITSCPQLAESSCPKRIGLQ